MTTDERAIATEAKVDALTEAVAAQLSLMNDRIGDLNATMEGRLGDLRHTMQIGFTVVAAIGAILGALTAAQLTALIAIARALPK
jgi:hypothetical protein